MLVGPLAHSLAMKNGLYADEELELYLDVYVWTVWEDRSKPHSDVADTGLA